MTFETRSKYLALEHTVYSYLHFCKYWWMWGAVVVANSLSTSARLLDCLPFSIFPTQNNLQLLTGTGEFTHVYNSIRLLVYWFVCLFITPKRLHNTFNAVLYKYEHEGKKKIISKIKFKKKSIAIKSFKILYSQPIKIQDRINWVSSLFISLQSTQKQSRCHFSSETGETNVPKTKVSTWCV